MINNKKEKLIRKLYKFGPTEYKVFMALVESTGRTPLSVKQLISKIGKDRTTIQKCLIGLLKRDLIDKEQVNPGRGFMFIYASISKSQLSQDLRIKSAKNYKEENKQIDIIMKRLGR